MSSCKVFHKIALLTIALCYVRLAFAFSTTAKDILQLKPDGSANNVLRQLLNGDDAKQLVRLNGFVSKRRAIGKSLVFLDIVPSELPLLDAHERKKAFTANDFASMKPVQALMRRDVWTSINKNDDGAGSKYEVYQKILQPGVHCSLIGQAGPSRLPNEALLFCHSASYTLPNDNPQHLRNVVKFAREGLLDIDELHEALSCIDTAGLMQILTATDEETKQTNGERATEILSRFPRNFLLNPSKLMGNSNTAKVALLPPVPVEYKVPAGLSSESKTDFSDEMFTVKHALSSMRDQGAQVQQFTLSGFVQNRRRFQDNITVVEIVDKFSSSAEVSERIADIDMTTLSSDISHAWAERIHAVIDPLVIGDGCAERYGNILSAGSQILVQGHMTRAEKSDIPICWVSSCRLLKSSWKLNAVKQILELLHENKIDIGEAANALALEGGYAQAEQIATGSMPGTDRQWMAAEISQSLQGEHSRYGKITREMTQTLEKYAGLREKYPIETISLQSHEMPQALRSNWTSVRASPSTSRWERAKKPQLMYMMDQITEVLASHPEYEKRRLKIIDIGGGKGLLSNLLAETFGDKVEIQVVDISRSATNNGMMRARRRGIENIRYNAQDATTLNVEGVDVVIALHACGTLSDVALGHAASQGAGFVICPW